MAAQTDLWGEIAQEQVRTPVTIMKEQAALLGKKTQNVVEARVVTRPQDDWLVHRFRLIVPALADYTYELFKVSQRAPAYPVHVGSPFEESEDLNNEQAFTNWLRARLSSDETKRIIGSLLAQANS